MALTVNLAVAPAFTVAALGWVTILGAVTMASVTVWLVALPWVFVTTTSYLPTLAAATLAMV